MITDKMVNLKKYAAVIPYAKEMEEFAARVTEENLADGRYDLDGDKLFALVQSYQSKLYEAARMESHKEYIDLQYVASGEECIEWAPVDSLTVEEDKTPDADLIFYEKDAEFSKTILKAGMFGYYLPCDGHMPGLAAGESVSVKKIVFKIKA